MWSSKLLLLAVASVPALACDGAPTPTQTPSAPRGEAVAVNEWQPYESDYVTCKGDVLRIDGQYRFMSAERYSEGGKYQTFTHFTIRGTATGTDGSRYNIWNNTTQIMNDPPTLGGEATWNMKVKLTGKGPADNESFSTVFKGTMNASGEVTSFRYKCTLSCISLGAMATSCD